MIVTPSARMAVDRCLRFLAKDSRPAAARARDRALSLLAHHPDTGRPFEPEPPLRELVIAFGDAGYAALYRHDREQGLVSVVAFRHQREAGY